jgi:Zincin-like metallopeptidase
MCSEVPPEFLDGIAEVVVSPRAQPHPDRSEIYTMGECVPLPASEGAGLEGLQSRIVLYHGSFLALSREQRGFDWRQEAWETLTHELRHHLEWRARAPDLEEFDWAVEQNFARHDGEPFDPVFYLQGESLGEGAFRVEEDVFLDRVVEVLPEAVDFTWGSQGYRVPIPSGAALPCFLVVENVAQPPEGELVLALRRKPSLRGLLARAGVFEALVRAEESPNYLSSMPNQERRT